MKKGKLVRVQIGKGQYVKMYEADARAQGLLAAPDPKKREKPGDKMRPAPQDKGRPEEAPVEEPGPEVEPEPENDEEAFADFTTIPGVGPATARALIARNITTFDELAAAEDLDFLAGPVLEAIADWRLSWRGEAADPEVGDLEDDDVG